MEKFSSGTRKNVSEDVIEELFEKDYIRRTIIVQHNDKNINLANSDVNCVLQFVGKLGGGRDDRPGNVGWF